MNNFRRRIERLEERLGMTLPHYILVINCGPTDDQETPQTVKLLGGLWAYCWGGPLTKEEREKLLAEHNAADDEVTEGAGREVTF